MGDVISELRQAMAEFDSCTAAERSFRVHAALRVLTLVRELLSEVDGVKRHEGEWLGIPLTNAEPLGPPDPAHGELPWHDDPPWHESVDDGVTTDEEGGLVCLTCGLSIGDAVHQPEESDG